MHVIQFSVYYECAIIVIEACLLNTLLFAVFASSLRLLILISDYCDSLSKKKEAAVEQVLYNRWI